MAIQYHLGGGNATLQHMATLCDGLDPADQHVEYAAHLKLATKQCSSYLRRWLVSNMRMW